MTKKSDKFTIKPITEAQLPKCLEVIQKSFTTVAKDFGLTEQNFPKHTSFMKLEKLKYQFRNGYWMYGYYDGGIIFGFFSLNYKGNGAYELNNLAVHPENRHNGHGKKLIEFAKKKVVELGGRIIEISIIEENKVLKNWYAENGFIHTGTIKFSHQPFTAGYMKWEAK